MTFPWLDTIPGRACMVNLITRRAVTTPLYRAVTLFTLYHSVTQLSLFSTPSFHSLSDLARLYKSPFLHLQLLSFFYIQAMVRGVYGVQSGLSSTA